MLDFDVRALAVLDRLESCGYQAFLVGGCVRDSLRNVEIHDYDITTSALPQQILKVFSDYPVVETGIRHGTVTVLWEGLPVEVTTYRVDGEYADGRHPDEVRFTPSLEEDLARRDFTVNAMAFSPSGGFYDPFGGREDLNREILRCVGEPRRRFSEDGLRILRGLRFAAVTGFSLEKETRRALIDLRDGLRKVSAERIREEFVKLLCGKNAAAVLREFPQVIGVFLPEILPTVGFDQRNHHHCHTLYEHTLAVLSALPPLPHLRLAALLHDISKPETFSLDERGEGHFYGHAQRSGEKAEEILRRLRFDKETRKKVVTLIRHHDGPLEESEGAVRRKLHKLGDLFFDYLALCRADTLGLAPAFHGRLAHFDRLEALAREILNQKPCLTVKDLALNGEDLMGLGYFGPQIGAALRLLLNGVLDGAVENQRDALLQYLAEQGKKA